MLKGLTMNFNPISYVTLSRMKKLTASANYNLGESKNKDSRCLFILSTIFALVCFLVSMYFRS